MPDSSNVIPDIKISELPVATAANATDQLEANQAGTTRSITLAQIGRASGRVDARQFGATGDGSTDDTAALQAALNTGHVVFLPAGKYLIKNMLTVPYGSGITGETKFLSRIMVDATFYMGAVGVIRVGPELTHWDDGTPATLSNFSIEFYQPNVTTRAGLIQYPWAINGDTAPRIVIRDIRIVRGWKGLLNINCGGTWVDGFEASCFHTSIKMDEIVDVTHVQRVHLWGFGTFTAPYDNLNAVLMDGQAIGIEAGRVDTLHITDFFAIQMPRAIWIHTGAVTPAIAYTMGNLTNIMLDDAGLVIQQGTWNVSNLYIAPGQVTDRVLDIAPDDQIGCFVSISGVHHRVLTMGPGGGAETIRIGSTLGPARVAMGNMVSIGSGLDRTAIAVGGPGYQTADLALSNATLTKSNNVAYTKPTIHLKSGARGIYSSLKGSDIGSGSGDFIKIDADDWITLSDITTLGYTITGPANARFISSNVYAYRQTYTPVVTATAGAITAYTATGRYSLSGKFLKLRIQVTITNNGTGATGVLVTLPSTFTAAVDQVIMGRESVTSGNTLNAWIAAGGASLLIQNYNNTYPAAAGSVLNVNGEIEIA